MDAITKVVIAEDISRADDKAFLVALLKSQFAQLNELGFWGQRAING
jgi:hypothetical protein